MLIGIKSMLSDSRVSLLDLDQHDRQTIVLVGCCFRLHDTDMAHDGKLGAKEGSSFVLWVVTAALVRPVLQRYRRDEFLKCFTLDPKDYWASLK